MGSVVDQSGGQLLVPDCDHRPVLTKIVGYAVRPQAASQDVKDVFDKALANKGLLAMDSPMPQSLSDRRSQMRSKSIHRFFADLGITQCSPAPMRRRTMRDRELLRYGQSERPYKMNYDDPIEMINDVDPFVAFFQRRPAPPGYRVRYSQREARRELGGDSASPKGRDEASARAPSCGQSMVPERIRC